MRVTGTFEVIRHHQRRVINLTRDRDQFMVQARSVSPGKERSFYVRLARILSYQIVLSKQRINTLQGRRPTDDGVQRPSKPQPQLQLEG